VAMAQLSIEEMSSPTLGFIGSVGLHSNNAKLLPLELKHSISG
jgi:hypothetical protein